jgi:hypothetical protein
MKQQGFVCKVPGCNGPESGVCINGLSVKECPDVFKLTDGEPLADGDILDTPSSEAPVESLVVTGGLPSLNAVAIDSLLRSRGGIVVGVVAGPEVGKTTMIATLYELVRRGRMSSVHFAGSETLRGYEQRAHLARLASGRTKPDTPHTPVGAKLSFTHLRVETGQTIKEIFFSDRSGEHFDSAIHRPVEFGSFAELERANIVLMLVDLRSLIDRSHLVTSNARSLVLGMTQHGLLAGKALMLVGTKYDLMVTPEEQKIAASALNTLSAALGRRVGGSVSISQLLISSRAKAQTTIVGEGLEALMGEILKEPKCEPYSEELVWPSAMTEFDALMRPYRGGYL